MKCGNDRRARMEKRTRKEAKWKLRTRQDNSLVGRFGHLHMVLLNDVQKIVVVPQIQYIAACDATTSSPNLQVCSETVDICSKLMEWSMFLSWCRGSFTTFKTKKNFLLLSILSFLLSFVSKKWLFFEKQLWNTFFSFMLTKMFFLVCSLLLKSLLWICNCLLKFSLTRTKFYGKAFWCSFFTKELDVHLLRNTIFLILFLSLFLWSFME